MMLNYMLIGQQIAMIRKTRQLTQAKLAELTDLSVSYISFIEHAKKKPSLQSLVLIAEVMDTTIDTLLGIGQHYSQSGYSSQITLLIEDCTDYEKQVIFDQIISLKASLRNTRRY